jgi:hypothetical protein
MVTYHAAVRREALRAAETFDLGLAVAQHMLRNISRFTIAMSVHGGGSYLVQVVPTAEMTLTLLADNLILEVVYVFLAIDSPMRTTTVVATLTHTAAAARTAMVEEFVPRIAIEVADRTYMMERRVAKMLCEGSIGTITFVAVIAPTVDRRQLEFAKMGLVFDSLQREVRHFGPLQ